MLCCSIFQFCIIMVILFVQLSHQDQQPIAESGAEIEWKYIFEVDKFMEILPPLFQIYLQPNEELCLKTYIDQKGALLNSFADCQDNSDIVKLTLSDPDDIVIQIMGPGQMNKIEEVKPTKLGEYTACVYNPSPTRSIKVVAAIVNFARPDRFVSPQQIVEHMYDPPMIKKLVHSIWELTRFLLETQMEILHVSTVIEDNTAQLGTVLDSINTFILIWSALYFILTVSTTIILRHFIDKIDRKKLKSNA